MFGAVLHCFAASGRFEDAKDLFDFLETEPGRCGFVPGPSCYDAILLAYVRSHKWEDAIEFHSIREQKGIPLTPPAIQGLVLAHHKKAGNAGVLKLLDEFAETETATIDDSTLRLLIRVLLPTDLAINGADSESFRAKVRNLADDTACSPELRDISIELIRSIYTAKREDEKVQRVKRQTGSAGENIVEESWRDVLVQFVRFARSVTANES